VDEAAEPVVSADRDGLRACRSWRWVPRFWRYEPERPVGPVGVVMVDELVETCCRCRRLAISSQSGTRV
jgi:hypothetical protein